MSEQRKITRGIVREYLRDLVDTGMVASITSVANLVNKRINVSPLINNKDPLDGSVVAYPELLNVPVLFPSGGGAELTFPLKVGDTVQLLANQRSIEEWKQSGKAGTPVDARAFSMNDCIAIPTLKLSASQDVLSVILSFAGGVIRISPDGSITVSGNVIDIVSNGDVNITATGNFNVNATSSTISSDSINLNAPSVIQNGTVIGVGHVHGGVQGGISNTAPL